jgi:hypothetical protein
MSHRYRIGAGGSPISTVRKTRTTRPSSARKEGVERMLHIRLDAELHRRLRLIVAAEDTTLQEWVVRTLAAATQDTKLGNTDNHSDSI